MSKTTATLKPPKNAATTKTAAQARRSQVPSPADKSEPEITLPPAHDWRTTDADEINRRVEDWIEAEMIKLG